MTTVSLISLNVEHERHLETVSDFLSRRKPDVVCLQEFREHDIEYITEILDGAYHTFAPMTHVTLDSGPHTVGLAIFSRLPFVAQQALYYVGRDGVVPEGNENDAAAANNKNRIVLVCDVEKKGAIFRIATTHFTWTHDGQPDDLQRRDMAALLRILSGAGEFVFAADLNAPRGGEMFTALASRYKDNIPPGIKTSIDISLHRAGKERAEQLATKMVDGLFTTPAYTASDVSLVSGVSDHMAIVATIQKA